MALKPLAFIGLFLIVARSYAIEAPNCATKESCEKNPACYCFCSGISTFRPKVSADVPVFLPDDARKKYCYCKVWDLEKYPGPARR